MGSRWEILADVESWERFGKPFRFDEVSWETWLSFAVPGILIILLVGFFKWWATRGGLRRRSGPRALFRELAAAHHLTWSERRLLMRLARAARLVHPAHIFLDPAVYQNKDVARQLATAWPRVLVLRDKIFG